MWGLFLPQVNTWRRSRRPSKVRSVRQPRAKAPCLEGCTQVPQAPGKGVVTRLVLSPPPHATRSLGVSQVSFHAAPSYEAAPFYQEENSGCGTLSRMESDSWHRQQRGVRTTPAASSYLLRSSAVEPGVQSACRHHTPELSEHPPGPVLPETTEMAPHMKGLMLGGPAAPGQLNALRA